MQYNPPSSTVLTVCERLQDAYGSPRHGNPSDPVDDLVYVLLSNRTSSAVSTRVYGELQESLGGWEGLVPQQEERIRRILEPAGLSAKRATQLIGIAEHLRDDFGAVTLQPLEGRSTEEAESYLTELPGVSSKVAKCVLMYAFARAVLPVDVHVHRITHRLGWHEHRRADQSHSTLEGLVPAEYRYGFHTNCVAHGREVCRASGPRCEQCVIRDACTYAVGRA